MNEQSARAYGFKPKYRVIIALSHDMGEFISDRVYDDDEADEMVTKFRNEQGLNCYRKLDHWLEPGFVPRRHYPNSP